MQLRQIHAAVAALAQKLRAALVIAYVLKVPAAARAQRAGCSDSGFNARLQRARRALAGLLADTEAASA